MKKIILFLLLPTILFATSCRANKLTVKLDSKEEIVNLLGTYKHQFESYTEGFDEIYYEYRFSEFNPNINKTYNEDNIFTLKLDKPYVYTKTDIYNTDIEGKVEGKVNTSIDWWFIGGESYYFAHYNNIFNDINRTYNYYPINEKSKKTYLKYCVDLNPYFKKNVEILEEASKVFAEDSNKEINVAQTSEDKTDLDLVASSNFIRFETGLDNCAQINGEDKYHYEIRDNFVTNYVFDYSLSTGEKIHKELKVSFKYKDFGVPEINGDWNSLPNYE